MENMWVVLPRWIRNETRCRSPVQSAQPARHRWAGINTTTKNQLLMSPLTRAVLALALTVGVAIASAPEQIHIAFAGADASGNANGMSVSWATNGATATSTVKYGTSPSSLTNTATGSAVQYISVRPHCRIVPVDYIMQDAAGVVWWPAWKWCRRRVTDKLEVGVVPMRVDVPSDDSPCTTTTSCSRTCNCLRRTTTLLVTPLVASQPSTRSRPLLALAPRPSPLWVPPWVLCVACARTTVSPCRDAAVCRLPSPGHVR